MNGASAVKAAHGERLRALTGRPLTRVWAVWDLHDDEWFADCPVLFDFGGEQVELPVIDLDLLTSEGEQNGR